MNPPSSYLASYSPHGQENGYEGQCFYRERYYCLPAGIHVNPPFTGNALRVALAGCGYKGCRFTGLSIQRVSVCAGSTPRDLAGRFMPLRYPMIILC